MLIIGFFGIVSLLNLKEQYNSNTSKCGERQVSQTEAYEEYLDSESFEGDAVTCFCLQEFKVLLNEVDTYTFPDSSLPCR